jgi:hypothetical protein
MGRVGRFILYTPWVAMAVIALLIRLGVLNLSYWYVLLPLLVYVLAAAYIIISIYINTKNLRK